MNVYIWRRREEMTGHYHSSGGAIAIASSVERARELIKQHDSYVGKDLDSSPDIILPVPDESKEYGELFPDAGCC